MEKIFEISDYSKKLEAMSFIDSIDINEDDILFVEVKRKTRSVEQNKMLWSLLKCFEEQKQWPVNGVSCKLSSEEWKDLLTAAFKNETRIANGINGGIVMLGSKTSKMGKKMFSEFIEFIFASGAQLGINFPPQDYNIKF